MKYIIVCLLLLCSALIARPPHLRTDIIRVASPVPQDVQLHMRILALLKNRRKTNVNHEDPILIAIMNVLKNAYAAANVVPGNNAVDRILVEDYDLRCAIKYLDNESVKTKLL